MADPPARRLLIVGWDAADWQIADPLMARGRMPVLKALVERGVRAEIKTLEPILSPILWSSVATGKRADKHGILNFVEPNPIGEGVRIVSSTSRRTKALWNVMTQAGRRVHVLAWYASHPAEPINGVCISNLYNRSEAPAPGQPWPLDQGTVHGPAELHARLQRVRVDPREKLAALLREIAPAAATAGKKDRRPGLIAGEWARARTVHAAALEVLAYERGHARDPGGAWDCMMVFHDAIDTIGHHVMEARPPRMRHVPAEDVRVYGDVMDRVYERHDAMLGELLEAAGPDVTVILLSDHGFYSDDRRPVAEGWRNETGQAAEARWHRPEGMLVLSGPGFGRGRTIAAPTLLDIAPTALVALGLPIGRDMDGRVIAEAFEVPPQIDAIDSWDERPGEAGLHPPDMRQDPFEARAALKHLVELGYMPDLGEDQAALLDLTERETTFNLGTVLMTSGRHGQALPLFGQLVARSPDQVRYVIPLAQCQYAAGLYADCASTLRAFLAHDPKILDARVLLAGALQALGDTDGATTEIAAIEREHGAQPAMAHSLASLFAAQERWPEADRYYAAAAAHAPRDPRVRVAMARSALAQGQYLRAAEACLDATEIQMALPEAHYLLGVALAWLEDLEHAQASFGTALALAPGMDDALRFLAAVQSARGDAEGAAETRASARNPGDGSTVKAVAWNAERWLVTRGERPKIG